MDADTALLARSFGAGLMGAGIAQVLAHKGKFNVTLSDVTDKALANGQNIISKSLARIAKKSMSEASADEQAQFVKGVVDSIKVTTDPEAAVKDTDLVIEAIIENVGIKKDLFGFLDGKAPKDALFASNTSSLSITDVAEAVSAQRQELFAGELPPTALTCMHRGVEQALTNVLCFSLACCRFPRLQPGTSDEVSNNSVSGPPSASILSCVQLLIIIVLHLPASFQAR